jgi:threonine dehydrogenase-like Zn-dependent dehydrogenase
LQIWLLRGNVILPLSVIAEQILPEQLCPNIVFAATPPFDGTLGRYYSLPADLAYILPDDVSLEDGAMVS